MHWVILDSIFPLGSTVMDSKALCLVCGVLALVAGYYFSTRFDRNDIISNSDVIGEVRIKEVQCSKTCRGQQALAQPLQILKGNMSGPFWLRIAPG